MGRRGLILVLATVFMGHFASAAFGGGPITSGTTVSGDVSTPTSSDSWTFSGQAGQRVIFKTARTSGNLAPRLYLYPPGSQTAETDSGAWSRLDWQLKTSGTYTLSVQAFMQGSSGNYNMGFQQIPGADDADGGAVTSKQTLSGAIEMACNMDAFQFYGQTGDRVLFNAVTTSGTINGPCLALYSPPGTPVGSTPYETTSGSLNYLNYQLLHTGVYTLVLYDFALDSGNAAANTGTYNLTFLKIPGAVTSPSDPDGGPIAPGQNLDGNINWPSDLDAWQFNGQAGDTVQFDAVKTSGNLSPRLYLYPPGSGPYEADSGVNNYIHNYTLQHSGLFTLVVQNFMVLTNTGQYTLSFDTTGTSGPVINNPFPANGSVVTNLHGAFRCDAVSGATGYDLYFGQDGAQSWQKIGTNLSTPSLAFPALTRHQIYYWQVVAHTASGDFQGPKSWFQTKYPSLNYLFLLLE